MSGGPQSYAVKPREYAERVLAGVDAAVAAKVLECNASRLYRLG